MNKLRSVVSTSLYNYYDALAKIGSTNRIISDKLLVLSFLNDFPTSSIGVHIEAEDLRLIQDVLYCIYGTDSIIDYPKLNEEVYIANFLDIKTQLRLTEDGDIRIYGNTVRLVDQ